MKFPIRILPYREFTLVKSSLEKTFTIVLFDASFLISLLLLKVVLGHFSEIISLPQSSLGVSMIFLFGVIYYMAIILVYSLFKFVIMGYIKNYFEKKHISFRNFWKFYRLNIFIAGIFLSIMIVLEYLLAGIKPEYQPYVFVMMAVPFSFCLYFAVNISHSCFNNEISVKVSVIRGMKDVFACFRKYSNILIFACTIAGASLILFLFAGYAIRLLSSGNYAAYLNYYSIFKQASAIALWVLIYVVVFINRISFYLAAKER